MGTEQHEALSSDEEGTDVRSLSFLEDGFFDMAGDVSVVSFSEQSVLVKGQT